MAINNSVLDVDLQLSQRQIEEIAAMDTDDQPCWTFIGLIRQCRRHLETQAIHKRILGVAPLEVSYHKKDIVYLYVGGRESGPAAKIYRKRGTWWVKTSPLIHYSHGQFTKHNRDIKVTGDFPERRLAFTVARNLMLKMVAEEAS